MIIYMRDRLSAALQLKYSVELPLDYYYTPIILDAILARFDGVSVDVSDIFGIQSAVITASDLS